MPLSPPSGPYAVSTLDLEIPVSEPQSVQGDIFRFKGSLQPALKLETCLCTLFYPTHLRQQQQQHNGAASTAATTPTPPSSTSGGVGWLSSPKFKSLEGLLEYAGMSKWLALPAIVPAYHVLFAKLPYAANAPLLGADRSASSSRAPSGSATPVASASSSAPPAAALAPETPLQKLPMAVFSHGLGGGRTTYSQYLSALASYGMVIAAIEHRDASGPSTTTYKRDGQSGKISEETRIYFKLDELETPPLREDGKEVELMDFRRAQLLLRKLEVREGLQILRALDEGRGEELAKSNTRPNGSALPKLTKLLQGWQGRLEAKHPILLGHSFGGATAIELLREEGERGSFVSALTLDPWMEPLAKVTDAGTKQVRTPFYVINSQGFTVWRGHYRDVRDLVQQAEQNATTAEDEHGGRNGWLLTLSGTKHTDFSDFPFLLPRMFASKLDPQKAVDLFVDATLAQVAPHLLDAAGETKDAGRGLDVEEPADGEGVRAVIERLKRRGYGVRDEKQGEVEAKDLGEPGVVIVHPLDGVITSIAGEREDAPPANGSKL